MSLFVLCINPLLKALEKKLTGVKIGRRETKTTVIAYADDVTIVISKPEDVPIVRDTLKTYEEAIGAKINTQKSKAIALGLWKTSLKILDIPYYTSYTEYRTRLSEKELEYADLTDSSTG